MNGLERLLDANLRHPCLGLALSLALAIVGAWTGRELPLRLSVSDLLPEHSRPVEELRAVEVEVGGIGYLGVLIGPTDHPQTYTASVARVLAARDDVRYAFDERDSWVLRERALYLMSRADFDRVLDDARTVLGDVSRAPLDLGLMTRAEVEAEVEDARARLHSLTASTSARWYLSADGRSAIVFAKPTFESSDLGRCARLVDGATNDVARVLPSGVPFELWGRYVNHVSDTRRVRADIAVTSAASAGLLAIVLVMGLGSFRAALATVISVLLALGWTAGFARAVVGQINLVTGFMLAILGGLGVEYGIHLVRRVRQEVALDPAGAVRRAYLVTGRALFSAALTSAGAFGILVLSDFRGFSELGAIAGFGVLAVYAVFMLPFPGLAPWFARPVRWPRVVEGFGAYPFARRPRALFAVVALAGALVAIGLSRARFEDDLSAMRGLTLDAARKDQLVRRTLGRSTAPAALLASSHDEAARLFAHLQGPGRAPAFDHVVALTSAVPEDGAERFVELAPFRRRISALDDAELHRRTGLDPRLVRAWLSKPPHVRGDLPPFVSEAFGTSGNVVLVYSRENLDRLPGMRRFVAALESARASFPGTQIGFDAPVMLAIADAVLVGGRALLALFFVAAFLVFWLDLGTLRDAAWLALQLVVGVAVLIGLLGVFDAPLTILNVAMLPAVLAAGIDMGVHVRHREREGVAPLEAARSVAQAVQLGALTSITGFGALFLADATMLRSIAWVAVMGQVAMYLVCMVAFPALGAAWRARASRTGAREKF